MFLSSTFCLSFVVEICGLYSSALLRCPLIVIVGWGQQGKSLSLPSLLESSFVTPAPVVFAVSCFKGSPLACLAEPSLQLRYFLHGLPLSKTRSSHCLSRTLKQTHWRRKNWKSIKLGGLPIWGQLGLTRCFWIILKCFQNLKPVRRPIGVSQSGLTFLKSGDSSVQFPDDVVVRPTVEILALAKWGERWNPWSHL